MASEIPGIPTDVPASARLYGWTLGGKDNYEVDRRFALAGLPAFPEIVDIARANRLFLYRAVRYLAEEAGIRQFVDLGCGLPTDANVHQVAQKFAPDARTLYVDIDPIVLVHARALLADGGTTAVITADMADTEAILAHEDTKRLIDFDEPLAVLYLSVGHHLTDDAEARRIVHSITDRAVPGSHLVFTQITCSDPERRADMDARANGAGMPWRTRSREEVDALLAGLDPVEPGLTDISTWRPDPDQPPLAPVPVELEGFVGATKFRSDLCEYGGVLVKRA